MSEDKLHSFIKENKSAFDDEKAPSRVWDRIDNDLSGGKSATINMKQLWFIIGAVLILFSSGMYFGSKLFSTDQQSNQMFADIEDKEFQDMQNYYGPLLEQKQQTFVSNTNEKSTLEELSDLDAGFQELQSDFVNSSANNKEMMMKLMKENYELRIKILEMAMEKMEQNDLPSQKNKNYELKEY